MKVYLVRSGFDNSLCMYGKKPIRCVDTKTWTISSSYFVIYLDDDYDIKNVERHISYKDEPVEFDLEQ